MRFAYGRYDVEPTPSQPGITVIYRPVIPVRLIGTSGEAVFYGLLDSGADETLITGEMADVLGVAVDETHAHTTASASGEMAVVYGRVTIAVAQADESYRWRATVGVVNQPWREMILGHIGFLSHFDATFFGVAREVELVRSARPLPE